MGEKPSKNMGWKSKIARKKAKACIQMALTVAFIACLNGFIEYLKVLPEDGKVVFYGKPLKIESAKAAETTAIEAEIAPVIVSEAPEAKAEHLDENSLQSKIEAIFGNESENAKKIAKCESRYDVRTIGDGHLTFEHNGQTYGRSIGLFQIRTGGIERSGKMWTRTDDVKAFEARMMNPDENLKEAVKVFASQGWYGWYNCAVLTGVIEK